MKVSNIGQLSDYQQREIMDLFFPKQEVKYTWVEQEAKEKVEAPVGGEVEGLQKEALDLALWYLQGDGVSDYHIYVREPTVHVKIGTTFEDSNLFISGMMIWKSKQLVVHAGIGGIEDVEWYEKMTAGDITAFYDDYDCACNDALVFIWSCYYEV